MEKLITLPRLFPLSCVTPMAISTFLFRFLLAVVLLAPLPLGSNRPWSWSLLVVLIGVLLVIWAGGAAIGWIRMPIPARRLWPMGLLFVLALGWAILQTLPVTPPWMWHPLWAEAGGVLDTVPPSGVVSADPALTRTAILRLAAYGGVFWLAVQLGRDRNRAREAVVALSVAGGLYAVYGLMVHLTGSSSILWLRKWAYLNDLTATFVNRNAYGAYAGLGLLCCIGLFVNALRPRRAGQERHAHDLAETLLFQAIPYLSIGLIIASALLLSHSRGAFLATGAALGILLLLLWMAKVVPFRMVLLLGAVIGVVAVVAVGVSGEETLSRLVEQTNTQQETGRVNVYRLTLEAIGDAPYTGMGLGAFRPAFRMYRDTSLIEPVTWEYAHNVPLELAMDLGIPGAALFGLSLAGIAAVCLYGLRHRRRDRLYPALALAAMVLVGGHGLVDFSAQIPAIAVTLSFLLGIGFSQSWSSNEHGRDDGEKAQTA